MVSIRHVAALLVLVAVLPVGAFFGAPVVPLGLAVGCLLLVAGTLFAAFGPAEAENGTDGTGAHHGQP